eukprot:403348368
MNIHVVLPIKKLDTIQILGISQISIYIMAANLEYSVQGLFVFQFFEALLNASVFWLTDVFFFHVGLTWHVRYIRNGFQMTFTVIILLNLFLIYLYTYIGFEVRIIRKLGLILFGGYILMQFTVIIVQVFFKKNRPHNRITR